jgi:AcrR family transcriptional regulator
VNSASRSIEERPLANTPVQLLDAAERLFAEKGIDNVSIRQIIRVSGHGNLSAAHYHFGSRETLIVALVERRVRVINVLRHQRLDELEAAGRASNVYALVRMHVDVLGEVAKSTSWGKYFVRVAAQAMFSSTVPLQALIDRQALSGHARFVARLRKTQPNLPTRVFNARIWMMNKQMVHSLAYWFQTSGEVTASNSRSFDEMIQNTTDFLAAGIAAPKGTPTQAS